MPMSNKDTLDVVLRKAYRFGWKNTGELNENCKGYHAEKCKIIVDNFAFAYYPHDTGCGVNVSIITPDGLYEIVSATYWYSSIYLFNKETWNYGAWDASFQEAVQQLKDFVYFREKDIELSKEKEYKIKQQQEEERKLAVKQMFK